MKKGIAAIILLTLTLNCLPVFNTLDIDLPSSTLLNTALGTKSTLLSAVMLSNLPINIVTLLVSENGLLSPVIRKDQPSGKSHEKDQRNASAEPALSVEPANSISRSTGKVWEGTALPLISCCRERVPTVISIAVPLPETGDFPVLFLLGYLVILAKSNLPRGFGVIGSENRAILSSGFFICGEK